MRISWKHDHARLSAPAPLEHKIDVFEAQMWGWQLHIADLMVNGGRSHEGDKDVEAIPHAAFAALQVALVYFEAIARYEAGYTGRESKKLFESGVLSVFPELGESPFRPTREFLDELYAGARCGLYHMAMTAPGIRLQHVDPPVCFDVGPDHLAIDPHVLIPRLKEHFAVYVTRLRDPGEQELRRRFEKCFDHKVRGKAS